MIDEVCCRDLREGLASRDSFAADGWREIGVADNQVGIHNTASGGRRHGGKSQLESAAHIGLERGRGKFKIPDVERLDGIATVVGDLPGDLLDLVHRRGSPNTVGIGNKKKHGEITGECSAEFYLQTL